jgi:hypothetical protein
MVDARQGAHADAALAFKTGRDIVARLSQPSPDNATLQSDLAWFNEQIATQIR